jgi:hypothetical protein
VLQMSTNLKELDLGPICTSLFYSMAMAVGG